MKVLNLLRKVVCILALVLSMRIHAADLKVVHGALMSTFLDVDYPQNPNPELFFIKSFPLYLMGYYFIDARLQNMGDPLWMVRANGYASGEVIHNRLKPDLRNLYVENRKPLGGHWLISAGRMRSPYINPMYRLDGATVSYKPEEKSPWTFGVMGGMRPLEESGFRDYRYQPFLAGGLVEFTGKKQDQARMVYTAGFGYNNEIDHSLQLTGVKSYKFFNLDSYLRAGGLFIMPLNYFEYAYIENSIFTDQYTSHSLSFMQNESIFVIGAAQEVERIIFQEAVYRFHHSPQKSPWKIALNGGYSHSLDQPGYIFQARVQRNRTFSKHGTMWLEATARDRGYFSQYFGKLGYGFYPLGFVDLDFAVGYENSVYRSYVSNIILADINLETTVGNSLDLALNTEFKVFLDRNTEVFVTFTALHYFGVPLSKKREESAPAPEPDEDSTEPAPQTKPVTTPGITPTGARP